VPSRAPLASRLARPLSRRFVVHAVHLTLVARGQHRCGHWFLNDAELPIDVVALAAGDAVQIENVGALANFLPLRPAEVAAQLGVAGQDHRQPPAALAMPRT
jgi:hypothetical protein